MATGTDMHFYQEQKRKPSVGWGVLSLSCVPVRSESCSSYLKGQGCRFTMWESDHFPQMTRDKCVYSHIILSNVQRGIAFSKLRTRSLIVPTRFPRPVFFLALMRKINCCTIFSGQVGLWDLTVTLCAVCSRFLSWRSWDGHLCGRGFVGVAL